MERFIHITSSLSIPESELDFRFSRGTGPGGQHVNKVSTRVELLFDILRSRCLDDHQKQRLLAVLKTRIDTVGVLHITSQESRSQWLNRERVVEKLVSLLRKGLAIRRKRIATRPSVAARETRAKAKKVRSRRKTLRRRIHSADMDA